MELRVDDIASYSVGQEIGVDIYAAGDKVDVTATSKGRGFAGGHGAAQLQRPGSQPR